MFHICTIANDFSQYAAMKSSLVEAGFDEEHCRYQVFDNSRSNMHDPYQTINKVMAEAAEPYVIFCHQDVLFDKGDGFSQLVDRLKALDALDPKWAIAGNAGCTAVLGPIVRINDPTGYQNFEQLPEKVYSLDENFLVIRAASNLRCSEVLQGFHLYATDLCLQATRRDLSCYVIDFLITHLSAGNLTGEDFQRSTTRFIQHWNQSFSLCLVRTPCTFFYLSRSRVIRRLLYSARVLNWLKAHMDVYTRAARMKREAQQVYRLFSGSLRPSLKVK